MINMKYAKERIRCNKLHSQITSADQAADIIQDGMVIGVSGFTPSGYPKAVPKAIAAKIKRGCEIHLDLYSGSSVGDEIDTELTELGAIRRRYPYQTSATLRNKINNGEIKYHDIHLSQFPQYIRYGYVAPVDVAIVEALAITENGHIIPTTSIGCTPSIVENAKEVIIEINLYAPMELEGMADIYVPEDPPYREPIPICHPSDRVGKPYIICGTDKISAIVITDLPDQTRSFNPPDEITQRISHHIIRFFEKEVRENRLGESLLPLQSGVGSVANAVMYGLCESDFHNLTCYTEVIQDSMLQLLRSGKATTASTTALSPSPEEMTRFIKEINFFKDKIIMRPQEISNHPEVIRRLGVISMNTALEIDIYGNVNSTHVMGTKMVNGIGGAGDFSRNAYLTIFSTPSTAKDGTISSIVPMCSHVDHTEHETMIVVTEHGLADLRGLSPRERAELIIENCAHPDYKKQLSDYFEDACHRFPSHTPHDIETALTWHINFINKHDMR